MVNPFFFLRAPSSTDFPVLLLNQPSIIYERYRFNNRSQEKQNQSIHTWLLCELLPKPANLESWKTIFSATELCVESEKMLLEEKYCKNLGCLCQTVWISTKPRKLHHHSSKKETVYWPGMPTKIRDYISKREAYTSCKKEQRKEPLVSHNTPSHPWEIVGYDIVHFDNRYLCTVDYYSSYFKIDPLKDQTAREVIRTLKRHFLGCGIPNKLMSDNGLSFNSYEFQQFSTNYDMEHVTSSPHYPQGNGKVENAVETAKSSLRKSKAARSESI